MENKPQELPKELFPLLMSSMEKYHWYDSSQTHPNFIFGRLQFKKRIDPSIARKAWILALERQPLAGVEPRKINRRWHWVPVVDDEVEETDSTTVGFNYHECGSSPEPWNFEEYPSRLAISSHLEIRVGDVGESTGNTHQARGGFLSMVYFAVHHSICDGAGAILVVNEWLTIYSNLEIGRSATEGLQRLEAERLKVRNYLGILRWTYLKHLLKQPVALFGATKFIFRKTAELGAKDRTAGGIERLYPAIVGRWVNDDALERLSLESRQLDVTLNSIFLGRLFVTLAKYRARGGGNHSRDWIRIILPINIRDMSDRRMPAANRTTIVQLDRRQDDLASGDSFYQNLDREIRIIRAWQLDKIFIICIRLLSTFEILLRRMVKSQKSRGTVVFTNLGEPFRKRVKSRSRRADARTLEIDQFDLVGPVREGTPMNFAVARHGNRLRVSLHYDARLFSVDEAQDLLGTYIDQLQSDTLISGE